MSANDYYNTGKPQEQYGGQQGGYYPPQGMLDSSGMITLAFPGRRDTLYEAESVAATEFGAWVIELR